MTGNLPYFDFEEYILDHIEWSQATFGPGARTEGLLKHIRKELEEIEREPFDVEEWVDLIILAIDGAWRSGHGATDIVGTLQAKQEKNRRRRWPDWRAVGEDQPIEHIRDGEHE